MARLGRLLFACAAGLAVMAASACAGPGVAGDLSLKVVATPAAAPAARAVGSPVVVTANASPASVQSAQSAPASDASPGLRLPSERQSVMVVEGSGGAGLWVRREPGGQPMSVWPEGAPMLLTGADADTAGRLWRQVRTLDGETGWAAAEYLTEVDPKVVAAALASVSASPIPSR